MSSWNLDLEPILQGCVTAFMSTRLPRTSATKLTSLLLDYLVLNVKPFMEGEDKIFLIRKFLSRTSILTKLIINEPPGSGLPLGGRSWW